MAELTGWVRHSRASKWENDLWMYGKVTYSDVLRANQIIGSPTIWLMRDLTEELSAQWGWRVTSSPWEFFPTPPKDVREAKQMAITLAGLLT